MLTSAMNNTKWNELRLAMYSLTPTPAWAVLSTNGYQSRWDREWFYHFEEGGYSDIMHVDILAENSEHRELICAALRKIHIPGQETPEGVRVFGYLETGQEARFL